VTQVEVRAPVPGRALPLSGVPDPVFSGEMVGPGVAVDPPAGPVETVSPVDGRLVKLHPHAFVVLTAEGAGVLVHLGIDTVQLEGRGFELLAAEGDDVRAGQPIVRWDAAAVAAGGRSAVCPVVALDTPPDMVRDKRTDGDVTTGDVLFTWHR
jgi:PTS system glucose-specific IIA component